MSADPGSHQLRVRMARALAAHLAAHSHQSIADRVGVAQTTVSRRAEDLHQWPADDLLSLAVGDGDLAAAITAYLHGDDRGAGQSVRCVRDLFDSMALSGEWQRVASETLRDGRVDRREALALLALVKRRRELLDRVETDLRAVIGDD